MKSVCKQSKKTRGESFIATHQDQKHTSLPPEFNDENIQGLLLKTGVQGRAYSVGLGILNTKIEIGSFKKNDK